jgi:prolyl oligopeptidase
MATCSLFLALLSVTYNNWAGTSEGKPAGGPPTAPVRPVTDEYFGTKLIDPYRYMENLKDPKVTEWLKAQNDYTRDVLARIPGREALLADIVKLDEGAPATVTDVRLLPGGRYFYQKRLASEDVSKLYMREGLDGAEKLLVDTTKFAAGGPHYSISYYAPSWDGRYVAFGVSPAGSEDAVLHVVQTSTGQETGEAIDRAQFGSPAWLPDGRSFYYTRLPQLAPGAPGTDQYLRSRVYLHVVGRDPKAEPAVFGYDVSRSVPVAPADFSGVITAPGSRYAFGVVGHGVQNELTVYVAPLGAVWKPDVPWKKICDVEDDVTGFDVHGDDLYLLSHKEAPRFKVLHTTLANPNVAQADLLVPPGEPVIRGVQAAQDALYVQELNGGIGQLVRVPYGSAPETVSLPFKGTVNIAATDQRVPGAVLDMASWTKAGKIYAYDPQTQGVTDTKLQPPGPYDSPDDLESVEVKANSHDGTLVPLSIVYKKGLKLDGSNPTLLIGYGAYGITLDPSFLAARIAWLERGGVYAVAHVRGGGEYGEDWHLAGKQLTKPNTWKDFIACADYLVEHKYTSPAKLGGEGGSAGGITIGRAFTDRPELFAAAIDAVGDSDSLRSELMPSGPANIPEFGTVKDADGFKALYEMDAYHHVKPGTPYPAVLLTTGANDPRVAPWQAAKMTARLQAATSGGKPILLRVEYEAGHGIGSTKTQRQHELADEWSFLFWQFGTPGFQP